MNLLTEFCPDDAIVLWAANVLAQIAVVAALAWLLSLSLARDHPAVRHGIWVSAFVCVLISPAVSYIAARADLLLVSLRLLPRPLSADLDVRQPLMPAAVSAEQEPVTADSQTAKRGEDSQPDVRLFQHGVSTPDPTPAGAADLVPTPAPDDQLRALLGMVTLLWAAGFLFFLARLFHGWRSIVGLQRHLQPVNDNDLRGILPEVRRILNAKALPRLAIFPRGTELAGPITIGLVRPLVILPEKLSEMIDSRGLRDVLLHEFAHALRHDPLVGFLQRLLGAAFWPYPPVHLVNRRLDCAREEVCDNYVLQQGDVPSYVETLLTISQTFCTVRMQPGVLGICHPRRRLEQRVAGLLNPRRNVMTRVHFATLAALTAFFLTIVVVVAGTRVLKAESLTAPAAPADNEKVTTESKTHSGSASVKAEESNKKSADGEAVSGKSDRWTWKLANGWTVTGGSFGPAIAAIDELKKLIAEKKYDFVDTFDSLDGQKQYVYSFVLSDGSRTGMNFSMPLKDVSSWDDYQRKQDEQRQQRHDMINQAIAAGRFRLLNVEGTQVHLCRDVLADKIFAVQRIGRLDGSEIAVPNACFGAIPPSVQETSWQEHLQAIRDGKRTLLKLQTVNSYTYEMTPDDGTKIIFFYGGGEPLTMPEK